jgi:hypothetical protein
LKQNQFVIIIRLKNLDFYDQYRDSKQTNKAFIEFITRAFNSTIQNLLIELFNKNNDEIKRIYKKARSEIKIKN